MKIKRGYGKPNRARTAFIVLFGVVLIAGLSLGGAYLWQRVENFQPAVFELPPAREDDAHQAVNYTEAPPLSNMLYEEDVPLAALPEERSFEPGPFALAWQVRPSTPVDMDYFDDAIFFGDSAAVGIIAYRAPRGAASFAVIGITPLAALEGEYMSGPDGPLTMLEAAQYKGEMAKVYLMFGPDSLLLELDEFIGGYQRFISAVRAQYPSAAIYIQGMAPVAAHVGRQHPGVSRELVIEFNAAIAELARTNRLHFLNVFDAFADEYGYLPVHASRDGLHLSAEYHFIWLDFLRAHTAG